MRITFENMKSNKASTSSFRFRISPAMLLEKNDNAHTISILRNVNFPMQARYISPVQNVIQRLQSKGLIEIAAFFGILSIRRINGFTSPSTAPLKSTM